MPRDRPEGADRSQHQDPADALKTLEARGYISRQVTPGYYYCTLHIEAMQATRRYQHSDYDYTTYMPQELVDDSIYL